MQRRCETLHTPSSILLAEFIDTLGIRVFDALASNEVRACVSHKCVLGRITLRAKGLNGSDSPIADFDPFVDEHPLEALSAALILLHSSSSVSFVFACGDLVGFVVRVWFILSIQV